MIFQDNEVTFEYGVTDQFTPLDVKQWYQKLGGKIESGTEVEFLPFLGEEGKPVSLPIPYKKTDIKNGMPENYLCMGSLPVKIYQPSGAIDHLAISVYRDLAGKHKETYNVKLQYQIGYMPIPKQIEELPENHIPVENDVTIRALINKKPVKLGTIKGKQKEEKV